ncbi:globoside alpha-1,3-N-acetylgalactosaminyltransferase 1-like [Lampris incognitus]|uniref:globoside alpha-1,3-N-acetylgalactosaminyltransferase 1-like n=1 Tax=Lampris incognitus TaxID=2546036 RepID=UPI0024B52B62|nr:globoside alpha-1,3-N-acetylgalactosaminyltransferase 1-like [Lampris incognitus]
MVLVPFCKPPSGPLRVTRKQLVLYCLILSLLIYFLWGPKATVKVEGPHSIFDTLKAGRGQEMTEMALVRAVGHQRPLETSWGAPLVWGDSSSSAQRRAEFAQRGISTGLFTMVVGPYARFVQRFLSSAELHFLPGGMVTYYILTDSPRSLDPPVKLGPKRELRVISVAEMPGWERLAQRRMDLLAATIKETIQSEVEYIFCVDVDQEFLAPVREEILGDLVATLHPELYGMPQYAFPYETEETSSACVEEGKGDYYYTSELYGGLVGEVYSLARACSLLILQDYENSFMARGLEESYLNRYLIDHRPTCILSPEYSWWDSGLAADVPVQRLVSFGRQCEALDLHKKKEHNC